MRSRVSLAILAITTTLTLPSLAQGADFYLDPVEGSLQNDGSQDHPWPTLQEVLDAGLIETQNWESLPYEEGANLVTVNAGAPVKAGDTLFLRSGYHGHIFIQSAYNSAPITVAAEPGHTPELGSLHIQSGSFWAFQELHISPSFAPDYEPTTLVFVESHGWRGPVSDIQVEGCTLFSVEDTSGWSQQDWNDLPCSGVRGNGERITVRDTYVKNVNFGISMSGPYALVEGNTVENFAGDGLRGLGDYSVFQYNTVKNCYDVNENHDDGFQSWSVGNDGVGSGEVVGVELRGNVILNYEDPNQPFRGPLQGIGMFDGMFVDWVVENNLIIVDHYHGISLYGAQNCRVINNTVLDPNAEDPGPPWVQFFEHKNGTPVENCILRNNLATSLAGSDREGVTADHNILIEDADTLFVDPAQRDFHLLATADAVDTGSAEQAPSQDIEGTPRPQGAAVDVGAYEYHDGPVVVPDAGVGPDSSPPGDAGSMTEDGSTSLPDASPSGGGQGNEGCSCHTASRLAPRGIPVLALLILVVMGLALSRRKER